MTRFKGLLLTVVVVAFAFFPLSSAGVSLDTGTVISTSVSNYSYNLTQQLLLDDLKVNTTWIEFYNVANRTWAINNTGYYGVLNVLNLTDALLWTWNGSVACVNVPSCDGNVNVSSIGRTPFSDDFSTYAVGADTMRPRWVPQYTGLVNVTSDGKMQIDAFQPSGGDRDIHAQINSTATFNQAVKNVSFEFSFKVSACNQTWKAIEGVTQQGATAYLWYNNTAGNDFIDAEFKLNANNTSCLAGTAQLSTFKRVNGVSTALIPFTQYNVQFNKTYNVKLLFSRVNISTYNYTIYLNGSVLASSVGINASDVLAGPAILESAGTVTHFDDVALRYLDNAGTTYVLQSFNVSDKESRAYSPIGIVSQPEGRLLFTSNLTEPVNVTTYLTLGPLGCTKIRELTLQWVKTGTSFSYGGFGATPSYNCDSAGNTISFVGAYDGSPNGTIVFVNYDAGTPPSSGAGGGVTDSTGANQTQEPSQDANEDQQGEVTQDGALSKFAKDIAEGIGDLVDKISGNEKGTKGIVEWLSGLSVLTWLLIILIIFGMGGAFARRRPREQRPPVTNVYSRPGGY